MDRLCLGCKKPYWFKQAWMHEKCVVVHKKEKIVGSSRHGKYSDVEKRKKYRGEWTRRKRESDKLNPGPLTGPFLLELYESA